MNSWLLSIFLVLISLKAFPNIESKTAQFSLIHSTQKNNLMQAIDNASLEIATAFEHIDICTLHNKRGVLFCIAGQYKQAIEDFSFVIETCKEENQHRQLLLEALWGRLWSYAFSDEKTMFYEEYDIFLGFLEYYDTCNCNGFSTNINTFHLIEPLRSEEDSYWFCVRTVENTMAFMKAMCNLVKDPGMKATLYLFIDGLGKKANRCCRNGKFWENCVQPMVKIINEWKSYGIKIPPDPYWD